MARITVRSSGSTAGMRVALGPGRGDRVHVHRQQIDVVRDLARGVVGVAQADRVAVGVLGHPEDGELVDERLARVGHAADADPADHRGVHAGAADLLADPLDDQAVDLRSNGRRAVSDFASFNRRSSVAAKSSGSTPSITTSCLLPFSTSAMP